MKRYEIPQGKEIRREEGGPTTLKKLLQTSKAYSFTGYLMVSLKSASSESGGVIVLKDGKPKISMYEGEAGKDFAGQRSLRRIWEDSYNSKSVITLIKLKSVDDLISKYESTAKIEPTRKKDRIVALSWGSKEKERMEREKLDQYYNTLGKWQNMGYEIKELDKALDTDALETIDAKFKEFGAKVQEMEKLRKKLKEISHEDFEHISSAIEKKMCDVTLIDEIRDEIEDMEKKLVRRTAEQRQQIQEMVQQKEKKAELKHRDKQKAMVYDLITKHSAPQAKDELDASLTPDYTFDNFIVGESNRFAYAAAKAVANQPGMSYNPLFIWSGPGLGKTHLLNAIAKTTKDNHPNLRVAYITTEKFTNDLVQALETNTVLKFRQDYRSVDVLIIDDIQFLAGREKTQEEFFHTFNTLFTVDKQIILASDRPPKEIPTLEQRLISRFEGGLIADVKPPKVEMRRAILNQKVKEKDWEIDPEIIKYIAVEFDTNIRELEGALNKVMAFSSLMKQSVTMELARDVLRELIETRRAEASTPAPFESGEGDKKAAPTASKKMNINDVKLKTSHSYLIEEEKGNGCFKIFAKLTGKRKGLCISRIHPQRLKDNYNIENAEIAWLTDRDSKKALTLDYSLERLIFTIEDFIEKNNDGVVLLDGINYLTNNNSFDAVLRFLRKMIDVVYETEFTFMVSITPGTIEGQDLRIIEREMEVVNL